MKSAGGVATDRLLPTSQTQHYHQHFTSSTITKPTKIINESEFPSLGAKANLMRADPSLTSSEFQIQNEDFPALPGVTAGQNSGSQLSNMISSDHPDAFSNTNDDSEGFGVSRNSSDTSKGIITHPDGEVTNIPPSMLADQFGMAGLVTYLRTVDNPSIVSLALGYDLTTLGLNLNLSERHLYTTFGGPWADSPIKPHELDVKVPDEYMTNIHIREKLPPIKMNKLAEDVLFYLFYNFPNELYQLAAAHELYQREWRFHKAEGVWLTRSQYGGIKEQTGTYEKGHYNVFDHLQWRKIPKELKLEYKELEERPKLPTNVPNAPTSGVSTSLLSMNLFPNGGSGASTPPPLAAGINGKTKEIYDIRGFPDFVLIRSKDVLTAFNAERRNEISGKSTIANQTTVHVFNYFKELNFETHFVQAISSIEFVARKCEMIPIEWVARRVATGSFLKRNPGVAEGFRFSQPKIETFFKDDAQNDPLWSDEQILSAIMIVGGVRIRRDQIQLMKRQTCLVFRLLEKAWQQHNCALIDMKIEFGVTNDGRIILADVIDNDSWRVWPNNDRRLQLDKQVYRDMANVTNEGLQQIIQNYTKVMKLTEQFIDDKATCRVVIIMGSSADRDFAQIIAKEAENLGANVITIVSSAHKTTEETLEIVRDYEDTPMPTVIIAVAGRSNGLGPVIAGNTTLPVINCPPIDNYNDVWSSLRMPSGIGCTTVLDPKEAALAAAKILMRSNHLIFGKILTAQFHHQLNVYEANMEIQKK
ncbi:unnamed protein product [Caenorhabditis bovis]|uniref:PurE domain-containing protein n=1 Tax=Caenorhabditis bovis TaxID=2654633 RepID=A0A8S1EXQ1_9PELO|nr:unnamed protein product [Caenorhabditis bovis]